MLIDIYSGGNPKISKGVRETMRLGMRCDGMKSFFAELAPGIAQPYPLMERNSLESVSFSGDDFIDSSTLLRSSQSW